MHADGREPTDGRCRAGSWQRPYDDFVGHVRPVFLLLPTGTITDQCRGCDILHLRADLVPVFVRRLGVDGRHEMAVPTPRTGQIAPNGWARL
jgi:hypothetical protein